MSTSNDFTIRVPGDLKQKIEIEAENQGVTLNEFAMYIFTKEISHIEANQQHLSTTCKDPLFNPEFTRTMVTTNIQQESYSERQHLFKEDVKKLYTIAGYSIKEDSLNKETLIINQKHCGIINNHTVECKDGFIDLKECGRLINIKNNGQTQDLIVVSSKGFDKNALTILEDNHISCLTYKELIYEIFPIEKYVNQQIDNYEKKVIDQKGGKDSFIFPTIETDLTFKRYPAVTYFSQWIQDNESPLLIILGDVGSGKTSLLQCLTYQLMRGFQEDPVRYPLPVMIPLKDVYEEQTLEGIILSHFAQYAVEDFKINQFYHLLNTNRLIVFFDGFDDISDRAPWKIAQNKYQELCKASENGGKVVMTCRTHLFKNLTEQNKLFDVGLTYLDFESSLTEDETNEDQADQESTKIVYLRELDEKQIEEYIQSTSPQTAREDLETIKRIYHLSELALSPFLLEIIAAQLQSTHNSSGISANDLYGIVTQHWFEHIESKRWFLEKKIKNDLMLRLAWEMWNADNHEMHYKTFLSFLMPFAKPRQWSENDLRFIIRELMAASFLKRNDDGYFSFIHRSIMEFFLAKRLHVAFKSNKAIRKLLNTKRFDKKIIYFLTLIDKDSHYIIPPLQKILTTAYEKKISENALQILYWSARYSCNMEETVTDIRKLQQETVAHIPGNAQLSSAILHDIDLEAADLQQADLQHSDLTRANLKNALIQNANLSEAILEGTILDNDAHDNQAIIDDSDVEIADEIELEDADDIDDDIDIDDIDIEIDVDESDEPDKFDKPDGSDISDASESSNEEEQNQPIILDNQDSYTTEVEEDLPIDQKPDKTKLRPAVQSGHNYPVCSVSYHSNLNLLASSDSGGGILIVDLKGKHILFQLDAHQLAVNAVKFSPDGKHLASASDDKTVRVWSLQNGSSVYNYQRHQGCVCSVSFSPDNESIASASEDQTVHVWNVKYGNVIHVLKGHSNTVVSVDFSPTKNVLASASYDHTIRLWDTTTGEPVKELEGHQRYVSSVTFSVDGNFLASGSDDQTVRVWDLQKGDTRHVLHGHSSTVTAVDFSSDGKVLASASYDQTVRLWDVQNAYPVNILKGHQKYVSSVAFLSDNTQLVSGSDDQTMRLWDTQKGGTVHVFEENKNSITAVSFSPDGKSLVNGNTDHTVCLWNIQNGDAQVLEGHQAQVNAVHYSPDSQFVASGSDDQTIRIWDIQNKTSVHVLYGHSSTVSTVDFSPDGKALASGSHDQTIRVWSVQRGESLKALKGHTHPVLSVKFSPNGQTLASASHDKTVRLWNVKYGRALQTLKGHSKSVVSVSFSPDGKFIASGSYDQTVRLWKAQKGKIVHVLKGHSHSVVSVAFSPDSKYLASGSYDQTVKLWDVQTGECRKTLKGHWGGVYSVQFSKNGKYLVATGTGGRIQFWDPFIGKTFLYRYYFKPDAWLDLMPEGRFNGSTEALKYLRYTEIGTLKSYPSKYLVEDFFKPDDVKSLLLMYNEGRVQAVKQL
ncbi:MAG: pentapeptide repeat-containing protein [Candidatus Magnetomorum sp.]|nr:pentapeptide repeat-containing protein [Candidatus Magnetomorum sp.]